MKEIEKKWHCHDIVIRGKLVVVMVFCGKLEGTGEVPIEHFSAGPSLPACWAATAKAVVISLDVDSAGK